MRNFILCITEHSALWNSEGKKRKKRRKKSEEKNENKKTATSSRAFVAVIATRLSAAPSGMKDGLGQQCTTECSSSISPQARGGTKPKRPEAKETVGNELLGNALFRE